jgi:hypothetical protein
MMAALFGDELRRPLGGPGGGTSGSGNRSAVRQSGRS